MYLRKVDQGGAGICSWCTDFLIYRSPGKKQLLKNAVQCKKKKNENRKSKTQNTTLPISWFDPPVTAKPSDKCSQPSWHHGTPGNVHDSNACSTRKLLVPKPIVAATDRVSATEALVLFLAVENSIPISTVPKLVEFSKLQVKDTKALKEVKMDRTSATHKLKDSLATNNHTKLVEKLRPYLFSVNIDKCVHGNNKKVFSVFVTFYDKGNTRLCCGALRLSRVRCCICASFN